MTNCDCGAATEGKWAGKHTPGCAALSTIMHIETVIGNLGAALVQQAPSDDKIIMDHVRDAYEAAKKALIVVDRRPHTHAAGTMVGKPIDQCAVCGSDIRDPIHTSQRKG